MHSRNVPQEIKRDAVKHLFSKIFVTTPFFTIVDNWKHPPRSRRRMTNYRFDSAIAAIRLCGYILFNDVGKRSHVMFSEYKRHENSYVK